MIPSKHEVASQHTSSTPDLAPRWLLSIAYNFVLFWLFLFRREWGIGLTLFEVGHLLPTVLTTKTKSPFFFIKVALAVIISTFWWSRDFDLVQALSLLAVLGLNFMIYQEAESGELITPEYLIKAPFIWISKLLFYSAAVVNGLTHWRKSIKGVSKVLDNQVAKRVIVGVIISIPVLAVFVVLFSSADQNFEALTTHVIEKIFKFIDLSWLQNLTWLQDWVVQFLCFWFYLCFVLPYPWKFEKKEKTFKEHLIEKTTMGGLVGLIFAVFIATQFKSFSAILHGFKTGQLNPALYVREGFAQLLIACAVGIGVFVLLKNDIVRKFVSKLRQTALIVALTLLGEIFLVSLVAGERVWLYQYQFGLTRIRILGILFLLFLFSVISILLADIFRKVRWHTKWQLYILSAVMVVFVAGAMNMDHFIVSTRPPVVNGEVHYEHIAETMSYDASDFWLTNLKDVKAGMLGNCTVKRENGQLVIPTGFSSFGDLRTACKSKVEELEKAYKLITYLPLFIRQAERPFGYINWDDTYNPEPANANEEAVKTICKKVDEKTPWLSGNRSQIENRKALCENYDTWMQFKGEYETLREATGNTHSPVTVKVINLIYSDPANPPGYGLTASPSYPFYQPNQLASEMNEATKFKGSGDSALHYEVVDNITVNRTPTKKTDGERKWTDYNAVLKEFPQICQKINSGEADEVWMWTSPQSFNSSGGFNIAGPGIRGNSGELDPLTWFNPCGNRTMTIMTFDYSKDTTDQMGYMAYRMDYMAMLIDYPASAQFENNASSSQLIIPVSPRKDKGQEIWACGSYSFPPNNTFGGSDSWTNASKRKVQSDCDDWNLERSGEYKEIDCTVWGCTDIGFYRWWMQHVPGLNNKAKNKAGDSLPNWWYAFARYDEYIKMVNHGQPYKLDDRLQLPLF